MSQTTSELKTEFDNSLALIRTLGDEVRMKVHVAETDAREEWHKLEPTLAQVEKAGAELTEATSSMR